jgi:uncharacterized protein (TIGR02453 family)
MFRGWPAEAIEFYEGLEADNSKSYWNDNKSTYESVVRAPMEDLLSELSPEWGEWRIFRPYRDVRFSSDKSLYKTNIGATIGPGYVQLSADGLAAGCGMWEMAPDQLERYRACVDDAKAGAKLERLVAELRSTGIDVISRESLKTVPRGYPKEHPRVELLRCKGLAAWKEWPPGPWLGRASAKDRVTGFLSASKSLSVWLDANVGESTLPRRDR